MAGHFLIGYNMHLSYDLEKAIPENFDAHIRHIYNVSNRNLSISFSIAKRTFTFTCKDTFILISLTNPVDNYSALPAEDAIFYKEMCKLFPENCYNADDIVSVANKVAKFMLNFDFYKGFI